MAIAYLFSSTSSYFWSYSITIIIIIIINNNNNNTKILTTSDKMSYFEIKYRDQLYADSVNACLRFNKVKPSYFHDLALVKLLKKQTNKTEKQVFLPQFLLTIL